MFRTVRSPGWTALFIITQAEDSEAPVKGIFPCPGYKHIQKQTKKLIVRHLEVKIIPLLLIKA